MNYKRIHDEIVENAKKQNRKKKHGIYYERHHIIPKCEGGSNTKNNLVLLTAREHFIIHKLLYKMYPWNDGLYKAFKAMLFIRKENRYLASSREVELFKKQMGRPLTESHKEAIRKANTGHINTLEHRQNSSKGLKKFYETNKSHWLGKKHKQESVEKGRIKKKQLWIDKPEEEKLEWSIKFSGENNANFGKPRSDEVKKKISEKHAIPLYFDGVYYNSSSECSEKLNIDKRKISKIIRKYNNENYHYVECEAYDIISNNAKSSAKFKMKRILFNGLEYESLEACAKVINRTSSRVRQIIREQISLGNSLYQYLDK